MKYKSEVIGKGGIRARVVADSIANRSSTRIGCLAAISPAVGRFLLKR